MADAILTKLREQKEELERQLSLKQIEIKPLRDQMSVLDREIGNLRGQISTVDKEIARIKTVPTVTDHAVIRYLERKYGFSFDQAKKEIMTPKLIDAIRAGVSGYKIDGGRFVINGNAVVTYTTNKNNG